MPFLKKRKEKRKYVARPGIEPRMDLVIHATHMLDDSFALVSKFQKDDDKRNTL